MSNGANRLAERCASTTTITPMTNEPRIFTTIVAHGNPGPSRRTPASPTRYRPEAPIAPWPPAVGVAAGGAYEYSNKQALEDLEDDYEDGRISKEEYERRRKEIEDRSLVY